MHKKHIALAAVTCALALTACGSKTDPNEKNFGAAVSQYLEKKGEMCLSADKWPIDLRDSDLRSADNPDSLANRLAVFEKLGLVKSESIKEETNAQIVMFFGKKVARFTITDAGKAFVRPGTNEYYRFCFAHGALDKVVKWEGPAEFGEFKVARVTYTYKLKNVAPWARDPAVMTAFEPIKSAIEGEGKREQKLGVKLTSIGWEPEGLD